MPGYELVIGLRLTVRVGAQRGHRSDGRGRRVRTPSAEASDATEGPREGVVHGVRDQLFEIRFELGRDGLREIPGLDGRVDSSLCVGDQRVDQRVEINVLRLRDVGDRLTVAQVARQIVRRDAERLGDGIDRPAQHATQTEAETTEDRVARAPRSDRAAAAVPPNGPFPPNSGKLGSGLFTRFEMSVLATASIAAITAWTSTFCWAATSAMVVLPSLSFWTRSAVRGSTRFGRGVEEALVVADAGAERPRGSRASDAWRRSRSARWAPTGGEFDALELPGMPMSAPATRRPRPAATTTPAAIMRRPIMLLSPRVRFDRPPGSTTRLATRWDRRGEFPGHMGLRTTSRVPLRLDTVWPQAMVRPFSRD